jgi:broad specificity phosphatase PhoE
MKQTVWITRHGNRLDFVDPEWFHTAERPHDTPLSPDGIDQARALAKRLSGEGIAHIFASPFLRTVETAHYVAAALGLPIRVETGLSEWLNPDWFLADPTRLTLQALAQCFPEVDLSYSSRVEAHYPETGEQALERAGRTARIIAQEFGGNLLMVGHGASVLGATRGLVGNEVEVHAAYCCLVKLVRTENEWVMELKGDVSHLAASEQVLRFSR